MLCMILKSFPFSRNGVKIEDAVKDETVDIPDALVEGLEAEGFVERLGEDDKVETKVVETTPETKGGGEAGAIDVTAMSDDELKVHVEKVTGQKPHWNAKRDTVLAMLNGQQPE